MFTYVLRTKPYVWRSMIPSKNRNTTVLEKQFKEVQEQIFPALKERLLYMLSRYNKQYEIDFDVLYDVDK